MIKPQDVLALLKLISIGSDHWTYRDLSYSLGLGISQLHSSVKRLSQAKLLVTQDGNITPNIRNSEEFLINAVKYFFPAEKGEVTRGVPTAHSAPPLNQHIAPPSNDLPVVWPNPEGETRGTGFLPIHKTAVRAAQKDSYLYELLTLLDAVRGGNVREQAIAGKELVSRLQQYREL